MPNSASLPPGFRFHPTDEELLLHYLRSRASSSPCPVSIIAEVDIYKYDPWELPAKAAYGDREWYFFSPRDRKYPNGFRPNRAAASGYWKATGTDKPIHASEGEGKNEVIGVKKALVFYQGKPPRGAKTNWIMHEYRLVVAQSDNSYRPLRPTTDSSMRLDDWVLCRIYKKNSHIEGLTMDDEVGQDLTDTNSSIFNNNMKQQLPRLQKSVSIDDFLEDYSLNQLLGNSPEIMFPAANSTSPVGQTGLAQLLSRNSAMIHGNNNLEPSALVADNSMKRQRMEESYVNSNTNSNGFLHPLKRQNCGGNVYRNFSPVQMDSSLLDQQFLSQQPLLSSHLGSTDHKCTDCGNQVLDGPFYNLLNSRGSIEAE